MKKTLAVILALIMLLSASLVACAKKPTGTSTGTPTNDPFAIPTETPKDATDNNSSSTDKVSIDMTEASGTYYLLHTIKVRKEAMKSSSTVGIAKFSSEVQLLAKDDTWYKISFTDSETKTKKEGYVYQEVLTASVEAVTTVMLETPVKAKISGLGMKDDGKTPYTINIRMTPWNSANSKITGYKNANVLGNILNEKYKVSDGFEVTKLGATADGKWVYITYTVKVDGKDVTEYGYCSSQYVTVEGETPATPTPGGNTPGGDILPL